jgi:hypothetical protein
MVWPFVAYSSLAVSSLATEAPLRVERSQTALRDIPSGRTGSGELRASHDALVANGGMYRVAPVAEAVATTPSRAGTAGTIVVPLRYVWDDDLARIMPPYVGRAAGSPPTRRVTP